MFPANGGWGGIIATETPNHVIKYWEKTFSSEGPVCCGCLVIKSRESFAVQEASVLYTRDLLIGECQYYLTRFCLDLLRASYRLKLNRKSAKTTWLPAIAHLGDRGCVGHARAHRLWMTFIAWSAVCSCNQESNQWLVYHRSWGNNSCCSWAIW